MTRASEIVTNLKPSTRSYDEEMRARQSYDRAPDYRPEIAPVDFEEAIGSRFEANYAAAAESRLPDDKHFRGVEKRLRRFVNFMHPHRFFRQLQSSGIDARIETPDFDVWLPEDSSGRLICVKKPRTIGRLWLHNEVVRDRVGVSAWVWNKDKRIRERKLVTWLQWPYGPEWSLVKFDEFDVPQYEQWRGWRTALLHLIEADVITEAEALKAFGNVALDEVSLIYRRHLYVHRQRKAGLIQ